MINFFRSFMGLILIALFATLSSACPLPAYADEVAKISWSSISNFNPIDRKDYKTLVGTTTLSDGTSIEAQLNPDENFGVILKISLFKSDGAAENLSITKFNDISGSNHQLNYVQIRLRIDDLQPHTFFAGALHTNEVGLEFVDRRKWNDWIGQGLYKITFDYLIRVYFGSPDNLIAGTVRQLASAKSIIVELPAQNGSSKFVDLNPDDLGFASVLTELALDLGIANPYPSQRATDRLPTPEKPQSQKKCFVYNLDPNGDNWLALRDQPSFESGWSATRMGPGTELILLGKSDVWLHVQLKSGEIGWANSKFVSCF